MSDQFSSSDHVKRYGPVPTSIHPERSSRLSIWLWVGAAVVGVAGHPQKPIGIDRVVIH